MSQNPLKSYAPKSLYGRAALILLLPVVTLQLVLSVVFVQRLFEDVTEQMTDNVVLELRRLAEIVEDAPTPEAAMATAAPLAEALRIEMALPDPDPAIGEARAPWDLSGRLVIDTLDRRFPDLVGVNLRDPSDDVHLTLGTRHGPLGMVVDRDSVSAQNPHQLLVITILTAILMSVIAYLFLKNQLRPVSQLAEAATAFGRGHVLPYRPGGATEVRLAGAAFLDMRNRIERQQEQRTLMLSGISHDLRTPITRLRLGLSMVDDPEAAAMLKDVADMETMLEGFLDFAQDASQGEVATTDPAELVAEAAEDAGRAGRNVRLGQVATAGPLALRPMSIRRAIDNLLANAVRYGTVAELSLSETRRTLTFTVEDDGPGIPEDRLDEAMRPFTRLDVARNQNLGGGVGLGLAIAADAARQHGGILRLGRSERLGGLRADIILTR